MGEVARKVMGDVAIAYVEGAGGTRVSEDEVVSVGKNDVCPYLHVNSHEQIRSFYQLDLQILSFKVGR